MLLHGTESTVAIIRFQIHPDWSKMKLCNQNMTYIIMPKINVHVYNICGGGAWPSPYIDWIVMPSDLTAMKSICLVSYYVVQPLMQLPNTDLVTGLLKLTFVIDYPARGYLNNTKVNSD